MHFIWYIFSSLRNILRFEIYIDFVTKVLTSCWNQIFMTFDFEGIMPLGFIATYLWIGILVCVNSMNNWWKYLVNRTAFETFIADFIHQNTHFIYENEVCFSIWMVIVSIINVGMASIFNMIWGHIYLTTCVSFNSIHR